MSTVRPCLHKQASHEHGTNQAYHLDDCRCRPCMDAANEYGRARNRELAYGRWQPYVDAEPARQHVTQLRAAGLGLKRIAALSGVPHGGLWKLMYGRTRPDGTKTPSARIRPETEAALLAVTVDLDAVSNTVCVDSTGTRRRLQALVASGWSQSKLAAHLGMDRSNFGSVLLRDQVHAETARAVRDLYARLQTQSPPEAEHRDRIAASRARNLAAARGWLTPGWWDDDTIDDPTHVPPTSDTAWRDIDEVAVERACNGDAVPLNRAERIAAILQLHDRGFTQLAIGRRLGIPARRIGEVIVQRGEQVAS